MQQALITPQCSQQNGIVKCLIRTLEEHCVQHHRFETLQHASATGAVLYHRRPHQALGMKTPAEAYASPCELAARPVQKLLGHYKM
ncbi:integrase core domain-containing protein [Halomonas cupida]|uniref:integrase core domain-containing protein n=1 Tax=Halomonas cupida TaxID=44933 RepID=UPI000937035D